MFLLQDDFMTMGYLPSRLPVSCLSMAPRFDTKQNASILAHRNPLTEVNTQNQFNQVCRLELAYEYMDDNLLSRSRTLTFIPVPTNWSRDASATEFF